MHLIDIGLNFTNAQFRNDVDQVWQTAQDVGVTQAIVTGTDVEESKAAYLQACAHAGLFSTAGVHPHDAKDVSENYINDLAALLSKDEVVAVGECGLDFNRNYSPPEQQERVFLEQLQLAKQTGLPLFLHERDAAERFLPCINEVFGDSEVQGVVHCFTGSSESLHAYLERGFYIGVTGWVCDERRGVLLQEQVKDIPEDRLLIETDSPFLLPRDLKPKPKSRRNEPKYLPHILARIAELRGQNPERLAESTRVNTMKLFALDRCASSQ